jgi:hypothetical protein
MELAGQQLSLSNDTFKFGAGITFGIVMVAVLIGQIPLVGALVALGGWLIAAIAGVVGGYLAADRGGLTQNDGLRVGALFAAIGNAAAAVVGIVLSIVISLVFGGLTAATSAMSSSGVSPADVGGSAGIAGFAIVGGLIIGVIGLVSGTVMAAIGGAAGGYFGGTDGETAEVNAGASTARR